MENFSLVGLLTPVFSFLMIIRAVSLFMKKKQSWREFLFWLILWMGIGLIAFFPSVLDLLPPFVGIKSGVNILIFFGFLILFYGFFRLFVKIEELEEKIVKINRERALGESEKRACLPARLPDGQAGRETRE